jgi:hypothetical protein
MTGEDFYKFPERESSGMKNRFFYLYSRILKTRAYLPEAIIKKAALLLESHLE